MSEKHKDALPELTRYEQDGTDMNGGQHGDWYKISDVNAALARRASQVSAAAPAMSEKDTDSLVHFERLANAATQGDWEFGCTKIDTQADALEICRENLAATAHPIDQFYEVFLEDGRRTALIGNGPTSAANAEYIAALRPSNVLHLIKLARRASEGQAQTSAAVDKICDECCGFGLREAGGGAHCEVCDGTGRVPDAAQLADSTAPGAPELTDEDIDMLTAAIQQLDGLASGTIAALGSHNMLKSSAPKTATITDAKRVLSYVLPNLKKLRAKLSAAPTTQQSQSAGGAVPPIAKVSEHADPASEYSYVQGWNAARKWVIDNAAAPLPPQVQPSEALDAARLDFVLAKTGWIQWETHDDTFKRCQLWTQDEDENFVILSGEAKSFATEREAIDAAIALDQQAAQPVADSNGGVA